MVRSYQVLHLAQKAIVGVAACAQHEFVVEEAWWHLSNQRVVGGLQRFVALLACIRLSRYIFKAYVLAGGVQYGQNRANACVSSIIRTWPQEIRSGIVM